MTVYVDDARAYIGRSICCHMFADTPEELHEAARRLGLGRWAYQRGAQLGHYNVSMTKRRQAIEFGAVEVGNKAIVRELLSRRAAPTAQEAPGATISPLPGTSAPLKTG